MFEKRAPRDPEPRADYVPKSEEAMARGRAQRERILNDLSRCKKLIEEDWQDAARRSSPVFSMGLANDLTGDGAITHERIADIIRLWVFETYGRKLGLERYDPEKNTLTFRVRES